MIAGGKAAITTSAKNLRQFSSQLKISMRGMSRVDKMKLIVKFVRSRYFGNFDGGRVGTALDVAGAENDIRTLAGWYQSARQFDGIANSAKMRDVVGDEIANKVLAKFPLGTPAERQINKMFFLNFIEQQGDEVAPVLSRVALANVDPTGIVNLINHFDFDKCAGLVPSYHLPTGLQYQGDNYSPKYLIHVNVVDERDRSKFNVQKCTKDLITGKLFEYGTLCTHGPWWAMDKRTLCLRRAGEHVVLDLCNAADARQKWRMLDRSNRKTSQLMGRFGRIQSVQDGKCLTGGELTNRNSGGVKSGLSVAPCDFSDRTSGRKQQMKFDGFHLINEWVADAPAGQEAILTWKWDEVERMDHLQDGGRPPLFFGYIHESRLFDEGYHFWSEPVD